MESDESGSHIRDSSDDVRIVESKKKECSEIPFFISILDIWHVYDLLQKGEAF